MIDDYIKTPEQVVDYSTRYSGLVSGDLDPAISKHHLIPLKRAYLKIRFMVDSGWTFVGHHLQKDFRILNIYVPPERIIDTVQVSEPTGAFCGLQLTLVCSCIGCLSTVACYRSDFLLTTCLATSCKSTHTIPTRTRALRSSSTKSAVAAALLACFLIINFIVTRRFSLPVDFFSTGTKRSRRPAQTR